MGSFIIGIVAAIGAAFAATILFFVAALMGTLFGGIGAWIVGIFFPIVLSTTNELLGTSLTDFQTGALLGFVGGFFRSISTK